MIYLCESAGVIKNAIFGIYNIATLLEYKKEDFTTWILQK